ncbi:NAC domain-containing protein 41-like [Rosa chinensis]|uniref:NAC domain-containing protein 41-like n=1 Tax=Rosa chinensis TaxID=74649 RepID=UPI000D08F17A|nr:NAC domain-containing protein 41-like [Rosa chinensis]
MAVHDDPPPGYRFRPDTEQLLVHYLRPILDGEDFPQGLVPFCDLYGEQEPWQIWDAFKELCEKDQGRTDLYFITQHKTKTPKGKRISRTVGSGTWKGDDAPGKVLSASRRVIGRRKRFHYKNDGSTQNGRWLMHEFELDTTLLRNKRKAKDHVLCILRKNNRSVKKNSEGQEGQEEDEMSWDGGDDQQDGDLPEPEFVEEETTTTQKPDELRKYAMEFEVYLKKQTADQAVKRKDHKDSHKMSLEDIENHLMSDD